MSRPLTLQLPDDAYRALEELAAASGRPPAEWLADNLTRLLVPPGHQVPRESIHPDMLALLEHRAADEGVPVEEAIRQWKLQRGMKG